MIELPDIERANRLHRQGLTYAEIGKLIGVSRQRAHQIAHPKETLLQRAIQRSDVSEQQRLRNRSERLKVIGHYSHGTMKCAKCGFSDVRALTLDHLNGGGYRHVEMVGTHNLVWWLIHNNYPEGFQVLCWNCQKIKFEEKREYRRHRFGAD